MSDDGPPHLANGFFGTGTGRSAGSGPQSTGGPRRAREQTRGPRARSPRREDTSSRKPRGSSARGSSQRGSSKRGSSGRGSTAGRGRTRPTASPGAARTRSSSKPRRGHEQRPDRRSERPTRLHRARTSTTTGNGSPERRRARRRGGIATPSLHQRYFGIGAVLGLLMILTVGKLTDVQMLSPDRYRSTGVAQRTERVILPSGRGAILDRNGEDLAVSVPRSTAVADPTQVSDVAAEAALLAEILDLDRAEVAEALGQESRFVYIERLISDEAAQRITREKEAGRLDGIDLIAEDERVHPNGDETRPLTGTTDIDGVGISGLESQYDTVLEGTPGEISYERSAMGPIPGGERELKAAAPGDDLELTIDLPLQYAATELVADQVRATESNSGIAIISRPATGEILSMVDVAADPDTDEVTTSSQNGALTEVFEPGSVSKMITVAAALASGEVTPSTVLEHPSSVTLGGAEFTEAEVLPSQLSVTDILTVSSNIGTIKLAQKVGAEGMDQAIRDFGFGEKTALDFPGESPGLLLPVSEWSGSSIGSIPIGQGISVTAMQMLQAYNIVATDGVAVPPRLVNATIDPAGRRHPVEATEGDQVVPVTVARQVRGMLANVVSTGTGTKAAVPGYRVAGKTGTARKPLDEHMPGDGYMGTDGRYHYVSTFVGMLPAEDPQLSIIVVLDEPNLSGSYYASDTAAPLFGQLATEAVRRLHLPPTKGPDITEGLPELNPDLAVALGVGEAQPPPDAP